MISKGVVPGPFLFVDEKDLISLIFGGLIFTNIFLLIIGFSATNLFAKVTKISKKKLGCFVLLLIIIGTYSYSNYSAHVVMSLILGCLGYIFLKINIPSIPIVLGFVMGPIIEQNLNRALTIHNGDLTIVLFRPITITILIFAVLTILYGIKTRT
jgi:putative tricarboxylic transport membrane protein